MSTETLPRLTDEQVIKVAALLSLVTMPPPGEPEPVGGGDLLPGWTEQP